MTTVLFVCLGNICRSPMAEAIFKDLVEKHQLGDQIQVDSAATSSEELGNPPHPGAQAVMEEHGLAFDDMRSRPITTADFKQADWIVAMDHANVSTLRHRAKDPQEAAKIHLCYAVVPGQESTEIPDPWYTHRFEETYTMLAKALPLWLAKITNSTASH